MVAKKSKLVVVLGAHRSGTSAITRGLQVMGVGLGDRMMPPVEGNNAKGFWEDLDFNALNIEMLDAIGSDWYYLAPIDLINVESLRKKGYVLRAVELLRKKVCNIPVYGIKDPRMAKLLPFWKEVFSHREFDVSYVIALRHPISVIKSLAKRDGIEEEQAYLMWLGHVISSLTGSAGDKRVFVDYDRMMQSPEREFGRIAKALDLEINSTELQIYKNKFLDEELRHTQYKLSDFLLDDTCPPLVREMYTVLLDVVTDHVQVQDPHFQDLVIQWSKEFDRIQSPLSLVDKFLVRTKNLNLTIAEYDERITSLNQAVVVCDGTVSNLKLSVAGLDNDIAHLHQDVTERDNQIIILNNAVADRDDQIVILNQLVSARESQITNLNQALLQRDQEINDLKVELTAIYTGRSWKITRPLRKLNRIFK